MGEHNGMQKHWPNLALQHAARHQLTLLLVLVLCMLANPATVLLPALPDVLLPAAA